MLNTKSKRVDEVAVSQALENYVSPIASTMGPGGKNVIVLGTNSGRFVDYRITQDGVSLTQAMRFNQSPESMLVSHVCSEASDRTWRLAGDGTTSTLVILRSLYRAYLDLAGKDAFNQASHFLAADGEERAPTLPPSKGYSLRNVLQMLDFLEEFAEANFAKLAKTDWMEDEQSKRNMLSGLAFVATHGDRSLVKVLVDSQMHIGRHGKVDVVASVAQRDANVAEDRAELGQGMRLKAALPVRSFANSGSAQRPSWTSDTGAYVCLTSTPIQSADEMSQVLIQYNELTKRGKLPGGRPLLVVAPVFSEQALAFLHKNMSEGFPVFPLMLKPAYEDYEVQDVLEDLQEITGAHLFGTDRGQPLAQIQRSNGKPEANRVFGSLAGEIKVTIDHTVIAFTDQEMPAVHSWVDTLMNRADAELTSAESSQDSSMLRKILIERANRILGRTARIILRGGLATDQQRRADLADDGARTLAAAMRSGVVPAQGLALLQLYNLLSEYVEEHANFCPEIIVREMGLVDGQPGIIFDILNSVRENCVYEQELLAVEQDNSTSAYLDLVTELATKNLILTNDGDYVSADEEFIYDGGDVPLVALRSALGAIRSLITTHYVVSVDSLR